MIRIYKSNNYFDQRQIIVDTESFFRNNIGIESIVKYADIIRKIDHAEILDEDVGTMKTPFGVCSIENVSTGCKTVISTLFIIDNANKFKDIKAVNVTEAGSNAIEILFSQMDKRDSDLAVIIEHDSIFNCTDRNYLINGEKKVTSLLYMR